MGNQTARPKCSAIAGPNDAGKNTRFDFKDEAAPTIINDAALYEHLRGQSAR